MIIKETLTILYDAISIFDKLSESDYFVVYKNSKDGPLKGISIRIENGNFWHLVGCELASNSQGSNDVYSACLKKEDISEHIKYVHNVTATREKKDAFFRAFDFVSNAKEIAIYQTENTPDFVLFQFSFERGGACIGYRKKTTNRGQDIYCPVSAQKKTFSQTMRAGHIVAVLSKGLDEKQFGKLEYLISKKNKDAILQRIADEFDMVIQPF